MHGMGIAPPNDFAAASGIVGDSYVASLNIAMTGKGTARRVETDGATFEELMTAIEMRAQASEPRSRALRPHTVKSTLLLQRLDRLWPTIEAAGRESPRLVPMVDQLRDLAELSDTVSWQLA